jgi:hypothetical protein
VNLSYWDSVWDNPESVFNSRWRLGSCSWRGHLCLCRIFCWSCCCWCWINCLYLCIWICRWCYLSYCCWWIRRSLLCLYWWINRVYCCCWWWDCIWIQTKGCCLCYQCLLWPLLPMLWLGRFMLPDKGVPLQTISLRPDSLFRIPLQGISQPDRSGLCERQECRDVGTSIPYKKISFLKARVWTSKPNKEEQVLIFSYANHPPRMISCTNS